MFLSMHRRGQTMSAAGEAAGPRHRAAAAAMTPTPALEMSSLAEDEVPLALESQQDSEDGLIELRKPGRAAAEESWFSIAIQVFFPYLVAGFGMVGAGIVLDIVQVRPALAQLQPLLGRGVRVPRHIGQETRHTVTPPAPCHLAACTNEIVKIVV